ncbi:phage tail protein [Ammoniphilus sp. CFH 90114]|uniref:phage tail protein n=1 Tax=Ammoniphilus sp. CFH 90114 TaxID=2493665 RepID=UPI00100FF65B|nr:tail fiber protein [Ammoniphilus sp. CFH 90114]RXT04269.1 phage tail protein [Ammoniphilus sp. CFH 90114]
MSDAFLAEIRIFAGNFPPKGWAFCNGQILPLAQNTALFSLLGTMYGGDGKTTFALPNLQGRVPIGAGQGQGLSAYDLGKQGGEATVALTISEMPEHSHQVRVGDKTDTNSDPTGRVWTEVKGRNGRDAYGSGAHVPMNGSAIRSTGNSIPHNNRQPYLGLNFIIALQGTFSPRS